MNDFSLIVLSFRCYAIHKYIHRFWGAQYNVRYIPRDQEAVSSLQSAVLSRQSAVFNQKPIISLCTPCTLPLPEWGGIKAALRRAKYFKINIPASEWRILLSSTLVR